MKRLLASILAVCFMLPLAACGGEATGAPAQTDPPAQTDAGGEDMTEAAETLPPIPQGDFGGADFTVLAACEQWQDFYTADQTGDVVNDAVYERNRTLEENYNIKLNYRVFNGYTAGMEDVTTALSGSVMGGSGDYDLLIGSVSYVSPHISAGMLSDLRQYPQIDLSQPWWYKYADEQLEIAGRQYLASGSAGLNTVAWSIVTFFNKNLVADYNLENLYDTVKAGKWTFDKLSEMGAAVVTDLDGNGKYDGADRVGLVSTTDYIAMEVNAMGYFYSETTSDGGRNLIDINDKLIKINDILYTLEKSDVFMDGGAKMGGGGDAHVTYTNIQKFFAGGGALFIIHRLDFATWETMREMENFGIIPSPKYDDAQEGYITPTVNDAVGIPAYVKDPDMSAVITEAMQYYSEQTVKPAYFETAIKRKSTRDEESVEMLDIIGSTCASDFMYIFSRELDDIINVIADKNYASKWAKKYDKYQAKITDLVDKVKGL